MNKTRKQTKVLSESDVYSVFATAHGMLPIRHDFWHGRGTDSGASLGQGGRVGSKLEPNSEVAAGFELWRSAVHCPHFCLRRVFCAAAEGADYVTFSIDRLLARCRRYG